MTDGSYCADIGEIKGNMKCQHSKETDYKLMERHKGDDNYH